jgi:prefoldin subunit 5
VKEILERKLKELTNGLRQMQDNLNAQRGAIQVVEQLLSEVEEAEKAEHVAAE